jgi:hypothetical protein
MASTDPRQRAVTNVSAAAEGAESGAWEGELSFQQNRRGRVYFSSEVSVRAPIYVSPGISVYLSRQAKDGQVCPDSEPPPSRSVSTQGIVGFQGGNRKLALIITHVRP